MKAKQLLALLLALLTVMSVFVSCGGDPVESGKPDDKETQGSAVVDPGTSGGDETDSLAETLAAPEESPERIDDDWRRAVLQSAVEHVLEHTALSKRDRDVYRAYALDGEDISSVAERFGISRNYVSQIKVRIDKRIVAVGRELVSREA